MGKKEKFRANFDLALKQFEMNGHLAFAYMGGGLLAVVTSITIAMQFNLIAGLILGVFGIWLLHRGTHVRKVIEEDKKKFSDLIEKM